VADSPCRSTTWKKKRFPFRCQR
jgi:Uncharacterised protein family (UPF0104).